MLSARGPHLLTRHNPLIAILFGLGGEAGKVRARSWFGVQLAPDDVASEGGWDNPLLQVIRSEFENGRHRHIEADAKDAQSSLETFLRTEGLHHIQLGAQKRFKEMTGLEVDAKNAKSESFKHGLDPMQASYLQKCKDEGLLIDRDGKAVTTKTAQSTWMTHCMRTDNPMHSADVVSRQVNAMFLKGVNKLTQDCKTKKEKIDKVREKITINTCEKCPSVEVMGIIGKEKNCETNGCNNCTQQSNASTFKKDGVKIPDRTNKTSTTGRSKSWYRKCWNYRRDLSEKEAKDLLEEAKAY